MLNWNPSQILLCRIFIDLLVDDGYFFTGSKYLVYISSIRIMNNCGRAVRTAIGVVLVYSEHIAACIHGLYNTVPVLGTGRCVQQDSSNQKYASTQ
jgi:hypothetical protein